MTSDLTLTRSKAQRLRRSRRLRRAGILAAAAIAAVIIWIVAVPVARVQLDVRAGSATETVGFASILIVPLVAGGIGWAVLATLERVTPRAHVIFIVLGCTVLTLSLFGPLSLAVGVSALATLLTMHVVVGATLIFGLTRLAAPRGE